MLVFVSQSRLFGNLMLDESQKNRSDEAEESKSEKGFTAKAHEHLPSMGDVDHLSSEQDWHNNA